MSSIQPLTRRRRMQPARAALAAWLALALLGGGSALAQSATPTGLLVHGSGTVYGEPDRALLTLGVDVTEPQVQGALQSADRTMQQVRQVFLDAGVQPSEIRTVAFNVWREDVRDASGAVTGERYHVLHSYQVTVTDLAQLGSLLAAAVQAGANDIQGIQFTIADPAALQAAARARAMEDAKARAEQLARLAGVTLGRPVSIEESSTPVPSAAPALAAVRVGGGSAPVEGGQLAVRASVTVRYAIQ